MQRGLTILKHNILQVNGEEDIKYIDIVDLIA